MSKEILLYEDFFPELDIITESTDSTDIATTASNLSTISTPTVSASLPQLIGYTQKIDAPEGFIFGLVPRSKTSISNPDYPASPAQPAAPDTPIDPIITRILVKTEERGVLLSVTNEVEQDILNLFDSSESEVQYFDKDEYVSQIFLDYGTYNLNNKVNADFMTWLSSVASVKGSTTIANFSEMNKINGVIGELKEALFKQTGKSGKTWIIVTPRIASYLSTMDGFVSHNKADWFNKGRIYPNTQYNPYVGSFGDTDVYVYTNNYLAGGSGATTSSSGEIYMGLSGGPNSSSILYTPFKKYIVKSGDDPYTGHSVMWFKIRDAWTLNPQDTLDQTNTGIDIPNPTNNSKFVVKANITFNENLLA